MSQLIITTTHLYTVPAWNGRQGFCAQTSRKWFAANKLSWSDFVFNGIEAEKLLATGDALAVRVVEHARAMEANDG